MKTNRDQYQIITSDTITMTTRSRTKAAAEVARLLNEGISEYDIYVAHAGVYAHARAHLLLPDAMLTR